MRTSKIRATFGESPFGYAKDQTFNNKNASKKTKPEKEKNENRHDEKAKPMLHRRKTRVPTTHIPFATSTLLLDDGGCRRRDLRSPKQHNKTRHTAKKPNP